MSDLFEVTHEDGRPWTLNELEDYARSNTSLAWPCLVGFVIDTEGVIYLTDMCGSYALAPDDCKIVMNAEQELSKERK